MLLHCPHLHLKFLFFQAARLPLTVVRVSVPFYLVQLTSYNAANGNDSNTGSSWAELREAQQEALSLPYTGMAVTLDIGDANDIHPLNKQDVGWRLALQALHQTYRKNIVCSGPTYHSMRREGHQLVIQFNNISGGLKVKNDRYGYLRGFEIAGTDQKFYFATATIRGSEVIVSSPHVPEPVAVRYAWFDDTDEVNLFNQDDLPAAPFRTDNWKGITENRKYQFLK